MPFSVESYTIQVLYRAYNLCPMTRSPFTPSSGKIQGQEMRMQTSGILIYLENPCLWVIHISKVLWHYLMSKHCVKKHPRDKITCYVRIKPLLLSNFLPKQHNHFCSGDFSHLSYWIGAASKIVHVILTLLGSAGPYKWPSKLRPHSDLLKWWGKSQLPHGL